MNFVRSIKEMLSDASTGIKRTKKDYKPKLQNIWENGQNYGTAIHIPVLHENLRWRNGYLYVLTGFPGAGKSQFALWLAVLRAKNEGIKIGMYSPENYPAENLIEEIMAVYLGKPIDGKYHGKATQEEFKEAWEFVSNHFEIIEFEDTPSLNDVLGAFSTVECGMYIIDPFNSIIEGADQKQNGISQYLKMSLTQMKHFAVSYNVPLLVIEHPKSVTNQADGQRPSPSPSMIYGGSMWWNKVDIFVSIDRDIFGESRTVDIQIHKVKLQRLNGRPGFVQLTYNNGRYE